jgi:hypothetical protein
LVWIAGCSSYIQLASRHPKESFIHYFPVFLEDRFVEKEGSFRVVIVTYNPTAEEVGGLEVFSYQADQNFEGLKIQT